MKSSKLPVGSYVRIDKPQLQTIVEQLRERGYRTVGPRLSEAAVVYDDIPEWTSCRSASWTSRTAASTACSRVTGQGISTMWWDRTR